METLDIPYGTNKEEIYESLIPQILSLTSYETDIVANMANICAALSEAFGHFWIGFYRLLTPEELVLGPFQGPIACTRIKVPKGVCGSAVAQNKTIIVPNVHEFADHIACSSASNSEIVVPFYLNDKIAGVLDIDSEDFDSFDEIDQTYLEQLLNKVFK